VLAGLGVERRLEQHDAGDATRHPGDAARPVGLASAPRQGVLRLAPPLLHHQQPPIVYFQTKAATPRHSATLLGVSWQAPPRGRQHVGRAADASLRRPIEV
jgi:hypothetical protein